MAHFLLICFFALACPASLAADADRQKTLLSQRVRATIVWETDDGDLVCGAQEKGEGESISVLLSCFSRASGGSKRVSSLVLHPGTVEMRVLPTDGTPLLVTAGTGSVTPSTATCTQMVR